VSIYSLDMFVFLDETGFDIGNIIKRYYIYSWRGMPAKVDKLLVHGEHLSVVVFMSTRGVLPGL